LLGNVLERRKTKESVENNGRFLSQYIKSEVGFCYIKNNDKKTGGTNREAEDKVIEFDVPIFGPPPLPETVVFKDLYLLNSSQ
jgi:hypothetical protein